MSTTNPVLRVLTTSGNQAVLAAGNRVTSLNNGQIGIFNYHTGLSVDGSVAGDCKDVFIAVGINRTSGGTSAAEDVTHSAGQIIQARNGRSYTIKGYMPEVQKVVEVTGFKALANTPYGIKVEIRNEKSYLVNGYQQVAKTFNAQTSVSPTGAIAGDNGELADLLIKNINADPDLVVVASAFAYQISGTFGAATAGGTMTVTVGAESFSVVIGASDPAATVAAKVAAAINAVSTSIYAASSSAAVIYVFPKVSAATGSTTATIALGNAGGTSVTLTSITAANVNISNVATFRTANPSAGIGIRITGSAEKRPSYANDINVQYHSTGTDFIITLPYGFENVGSAATVTDLQYGEGSGYDLKWQEYIAGGFNGKPGPYRQSSVTGLARANFEYFINPASNYNVISLAYDQESVAGWEKYESNLETLIAIPCADTTTLTGLVGILDAIFPQFQPMANDVASMNCSNTKTNLLTAATDGIEALS